MVKQISPAELDKGQFVTILEHKPFESFPDLLGNTKVICNRGGMGNVHTVVAVQLPYVVLEREHENKSYNFRAIYDTRNTTLMELDLDFVKAAVPRLC